MEIDLTKLHNDLLEILIFFDAFAKKNNLKYSLTCGTLLGAIRHNGFIPWDDDLDIMMPREDFNRLCDLGKNILNNENFNFKFEFSNVDTKYTFFFAKIVNISKNYFNEEVNCKYPRKYQGIWIDIFPFDKVKEKDIKKNLFNIKMRMLFSLSNYKNYVSNNLQNLLKVSISKLFSLKSINKKYIKTVNIGLSLNKNETAVYTCFSLFRKHSAKLMVFNENIFDTIIMHRFENYQFPIISMYDEFLKLFYGDYMTPPAEKDRNPRHLK